jgi:hypothetical protein
MIEVLLNAAVLGGTFLDRLTKYFDSCDDSSKSATHQEQVSSAELCAPPTPPSSHEPIAVCGPLAGAG